MRTREHYKPTAAGATRASLSTPLLLTAALAAAVLVLVRVPSLVQPMGADQGLYAYVAERILDGERPYIHAWDQKPPAIHYTYALMRAIWPADGVVAAVDLAAAAATAWLLGAIGCRMYSPHVGVSAALLFLLLSNPAFGRLGGVRVRAQGETFIAVLVTLAVWLLLRAWPNARTASLDTGPAGHETAHPTTAAGVLSHVALPAAASAGLLLGLVFTFKYNAAVYAMASLAVLLMFRGVTARGAAAFLAGCAVPPLVMAVLFADALGPLYDATIAYNMQYSGETYRGVLDFPAYLLTFPVQHARVDALWTLGGAGCLVLIASARREPARLIPVVWVGAACLSIAINSSRGLPQYFVQAGPPLALAAAWGGAVLGSAAYRLWAPRRAAAAVASGIVLVTVAAWRVNQFPKLVEQTWYDAQHMAGKTPREAYLTRYVDGQKYTAVGAAQLADVLRKQSAPHESVYVFGFTAAAYVHADRPSASRFFWSRPVIAGFNEGRPGYGVEGLLADLEAAQPAAVALQVHDWAPDVDDSAHFFYSTPALAAWLRGSYHAVAGADGFDVWIRRE